MTPRRKNSAGLCPYCNSNEFTNVSERKPMQQVRFCGVCEQYSILNEKNNAAYPVADPTDSESPPHT